MFISVLFLPQCGLEFGEALQSTLEVFDDIRGENVGGGEVVQIGERLVLDPEEIEAGLVPGQDVLLHIEAAPTAVRASIT